MDDTGIDQSQIKVIGHGEWQRKIYGPHVSIHKTEKGIPCRFKTQRKIILALGYKISDEGKIFPKEQEGCDQNFKAQKFMIGKRNLVYTSILVYDTLSLVSLHERLPLKRYVDWVSLDRLGLKV